MEMAAGPSVYYPRWNRVRLLWSRPGRASRHWTGANTYTGTTTISSGAVSTNLLANGGTASGIGQAGNAATNLVLNGGALEYSGPAVSTDRLFTLTQNGGTLDASGTGAVNSSNTGSMGFAGPPRGP